MNKDLLYLNNIKECIENIEQYTSQGKQDFYDNKMMQDAVIRNLEIIGEATKRLSSELRIKYNQVPGKQIAGLRDILIHDYLRVDLEEVWIVVEENLPELKREINHILVVLNLKLNT
ncbi:DUF86 domain-containing protein [Cyanobacterium sp. IPPAS B-1200]|uniref:HepT-like ribonuclease domain-containing protein n=1 Tax=Cyanobacterium sp. IPPAS B-1200 TaxID=1562720 RepID=UPI0008525315|nr:DUF86 domain-containing protein [Cyanobacterium sp. IPPAS B-1200]OEJ78626.1 hypothetical protein A5482_01745 [Cyanobacterium sp. IPPAS B-1200]